jgi:hypothetical protein
MKVHKIGPRKRKGVEVAISVVVIMYSLKYMQAMVGGGLVWAATAFSNWYRGVAMATYIERSNRK